MGVVIVEQRDNTYFPLYACVVATRLASWRGLRSFLLLNHRSRILGTWLESLNPSTVAVQGCDCDEDLFPRSRRG